MKLYVEGLLVSGECSRSTTQQSSNSSSALGVLSNEVEYVEIPTTRFIPCQPATTELENINPTSDCADHGKHFYKQCVEHSISVIIIVKFDYCNNHIKLIIAIVILMMLK